MIGTFFVRLEIRGNFDGVLMRDNKFNSLSQGEEANNTENKIEERQL